MRVKSINCTGFSRKKLNFSNCFLIKKNCSFLVNSATVEHGFTILLFSLQETAKCYFSKTCGPAEILIGPIIRKQFFLFNQTTFNMIAGESYPQSRYQTATGILYFDFFFFFPVPILILVLFLFELCADRNLVTCPAWEVSFLRRK